VIGNLLIMKSGVAGGRLGLVSDSVVSEPVVHLRPRKMRLVCWILAPAVLVIFTLVATTLRGSTGVGAGEFQRGDQLAMAGLGVIAAAGILLLTRPRVDADADGVRVRNVLASYELSWDLVRAVRFDRESLWASLELHNDEVVSMLAVQIFDRERAVEGVRALRALHAARQRSAAT